jgi:two-component system LytT family response regulator
MTAQRRVLIVDDEPLGRAGIRRLLDRHEDMQPVGECGDGYEAIAAIDQLSPDLVFLDVQMPELDGFGVLRSVGPARMPLVVFVTAYDEFAVRAFEVHAVDYLVKPVSDARFDVMLEGVRGRFAEGDALALTERLTGLLALAPTASHRISGAVPQAGTGGVDSGGSGGGRVSGPTSRFLVSTGNRAVVVHARDIDWIQAEDYYAALHVGDKRYLIRDTMAALESRLDPATFVRIHRSALVNVDRVREIQRTKLGLYRVILVDGTQLPLSRRRRDHIESVLGRLPV